MSTIPEKKRAAEIDRFGGPEVLTPDVLPVPELSDEEVLIAVHTAGVGSWTLRSGQGGAPEDTALRFPLVLGPDGAGRIAAVGSDVRGFQEGEEVYSYSWANPKGGFYAEYVAVLA